MTIVLRDVDYYLEHQNRERNSRDPADEADDIEDREDEVDDTSAVPALHQVYNGRSKTEDDLKDPGNPDSSAHISSVPFPSGVTYCLVNARMIQK